MHRIGFALCLIASPAFAETPVTTLNGDWGGSGKDRDTPMHSLQPADCRMQIKVTGRELSSTSRCDGAEGLRKRLKMSISFTGNDFAGTVETSSRLPDSEPVLRAGQVTGRRAGDRAEFTVRFPGLTPNAYVTLELTSPDTLAMRVTTLGSTLTEVTYRRR